MKIFKAGVCSVAVLVAVGIAGCGGSDDSSSEDSITETEFVIQANAICAASDKLIAAAETEAFSGGTQPTQADIEAFLNDTVIPEVDGQIASIEALGVPDGGEDQVNAILDAAKQGLDEAKADPAALTEEGSDPFGEANKLAGEYGMTECAD